MVGRDACNRAGGLHVRILGELVRRIRAERLEREARELSSALHRGTIPLHETSDYFGDLHSFSGLCLISGDWVIAPGPLIMLAGFVFVDVLMLDSPLRDRYGAAFEAT